MWRRIFIDFVVDCISSRNINLALFISFATLGVPLLQELLLLLLISDSLPLFLRLFSLLSGSFSLFSFLSLSFFDFSSALLAMLAGLFLTLTAEAVTFGVQALEFAILILLVSGLSFMPLEGLKALVLLLDLKATKVIVNLSLIELVINTDSSDLLCLQCTGNQVPNLFDLSSYEVLLLGSKVLFLIHIFSLFLFLFLI